MQDIGYVLDRKSPIPGRHLALFGKYITVGLLEDQ